MTGLLASGKSHFWRVPLSMRPRREGPKTTPAIISPMTWGCPRRLARKPRIRQAPRITTRERKRWAEAFIEGAREGGASTDTRRGRWARRVYRGAGALGE